ncbi:hypothetical protein [Bradyrhizobium arachidis]|uniref:hypothetical protein n=1 Tax=Bradyrhizobium arachidis TaxID=858423 RepID=UPI002162CEA3|nr:hypothetical protein [Bradyrhizobium arachidis]
MPNVLEFDETAFGERVPYRGLQLLRRRGDREAPGESCGQLRQIQYLKSAVLDLRRREPAHLERQLSFDDDGPKCGKTIVAQFSMPMFE